MAAANACTRRAAILMLLSLGLVACAGGGVQAPWEDAAPARTGSPIAVIRMEAPIGAPEQHAAALARRIAERAAERSIAIAAEGDSGITHYFKGYFSTITEGGLTTILYVWDVLDPSATRLHRIQGQAPAPGSTLEGWAAVPETTMAEIGTRTIDAFVEWLAQRN